MAKLYYNLIKKGLKTIDDVPMVWKYEVQTLLDADLVQGTKRIFDSPMNQINGVFYPNYDVEISTS